MKTHKTQAQLLAREILAIAAQFGLLKTDGTRKLRLESIDTVVDVSFILPETAPEFTKATRYHLPRQLPTAGQKAHAELEAARILAAA